jgi:5-methylthioadenosine/S-adenosylhomocysteine deaminase
MPKTPVDLIIDARWVLPIAPINEVLTQHSLVVSEGRILAVMPTSDVTQAYTARENLELGEHALMPGLINAHGHAAMTLLRGIADDQPLEVWLAKHIWPAEARWVSEEFVADGTELAAAEMLKSGTTTFADMYFYPEVAAAVAHRIGMRAQIAFPIVRFANTWSSDTAEALHKGLVLHDEYRDDNLINIAFGPHAAYTVDDDDLVKIRTLANELDAAVQIHLHETAEEVATARAEHGRTHIERLAELGLLQPNLQAVHMTQLSDTELDLVADYGVRVVHCPQSNLKLGAGFCPVARLRKAGIIVGLGTDGAASNNGLDMFAETRVAAMLSRALAGTGAHPPGLDTLTLLELATLEGARVLDLDADIGSLEPGKLADVIAIDLGRIGNVPVHHPESQLVFNAAGGDVTDVWIRGERIVSTGVLTSIDEEDLIARGKRWAERMGEVEQRQLKLV